MFHIFTLLSLQAQQLSSSALVGCCTTRRPTPATGPRMWPAARSIVSISSWHFKAAEHCRSRITLMMHCS